MSGPFGSSQWMYNAGGGFYPYEVGQSLRFNDNDSAYLSRTPASAGNRKTFTYSLWVKRSNFGTIQTLLDVNNGSAGTPRSNFSLNANDTISFGFNPTGSLAYVATTSQVFRDVSAWYHILLSVDTTQVTASDRTKLYVNGQHVTAFSSASYVPQNTDMPFNAVYAHYIGKAANNINYFDGYMAEVNFIDGQALDPTSFGEFKSDIWVPKAYTGAYGTNGFYLPFTDSAAIGDDLSGNGNDWTANNLVASDVLLDSPTNNYAVLNALDKNASLALSDGNLAFQASTTAVQGARSTFAIPSGVKVYAECSFPTWTTGTNNYAQFGIATSTASMSSDIGNTAGTGFSIEANQLTNTQLRLNGSSVSVTGAVASSDVFQIAVDLDNLKVWLGKNNTWYDSSGGTTGDPVTGANATGTLSAGIIYFPAALKFGTANSHIANFGQSPFAYTPPADYLPLNTANLPAPAIDPAEDDVPADYFNTVLYTGNGSTQSITGVGFQPDWVWGKSRSAASSHRVFDAVRGVSLGLNTNGTNAEFTESGVTSFDADGFSLGSAVNTNASGQTFVAWNWLAGNGTSSNTDGSITSTVSVNQKAGFSVVGYSGAAGNNTVGHGLNADPKMVIVKRRDTAGTNWLVWHSAFAGTDFLLLESTAAKATNAAVWNSTVPSSTVFSIGTNANVNDTAVGNAFIAYCFAEVDGFSKFGSYTGNGSADGPFVYCGFRPAFVMVKRTDSTGSWRMWDAERRPNNVADATLYANLSNAEGTGSNQNFDILSNGFKLRNTDSAQNASGGTYIFAAFSQQPFKYSNAR